MKVLPMTDDPLATWVETDELGLLPFQEYFVKHAFQPVVKGFRFIGDETARMAPGVEQAVANADVIVVCPSNPWVSIGPILHVSGIKEMLAQKNCVAVSPIVGGAAIKGPAAKMYLELGHPSLGNICRRTVSRMGERFCDGREGSFPSRERRKPRPGYFGDRHDHEFYGGSQTTGDEDTRILWFADQESFKMTLWAIVPVKPLRRGKSRLSGVLTENERTLLNYAMLENTLRALTSVESIQQVLVVSRDPAALSLAREYNARTLQEDDENTDLNLALKRATVVAQMYSANSVLILPADLPLLQPSHVDEFIQKLVKPPMVVISPDRRGDGTNALLMSPAGLIDYEYGPGSFQKHIDQTSRFKVRYEIVETFSIELDLDLPEDLEILQKMDTSLNYSVLKAG